MTEPRKPGRPKSPCAKCGGMERYKNGQCRRCTPEYMRRYRERKRKAKGIAK